MNLPQKIVIVGTSGSGKTTLGRALSALVASKCTDLDDLYWLPNWTPRSDEEFLDLTQKELAGDQWIICGNFSRSTSPIWDQADMIIWLDLPLYTCLWRGLKRSIQRWLKKDLCCNGNQETLRRLLGKDSILLWIWNSYSRRERDYNERFTNHGDHRQLIRLRSSKEVHDFLASANPGSSKK